MNAQHLSDIATEIAQQTEEYRSEVRRITQDHDLSEPARARILAEARVTLTNGLTEKSAQAAPMVEQLPATIERRIKDLAERDVDGHAPARVTLALQGGVHPTELVTDLAADDDHAGLLYLRSMLPSLGRKFSRDAAEARTFVERTRERIDDVLTAGTEEGSELRAVLEEKAALWAALDHYDAARHYALNPTPHGLLAVAMAQASAQ